MNLEIVTAIAAGIIAAIIGIVFEVVISRRLGKKESGETYSQKLSRLTESLLKSSSEVDDVLAELSQTASEREKAVCKFESELRVLENREKELQERVRTLENVPIPVAERFAELTAVGEQKSAWRDYILFGAGVVVSTVVAIILNIVGLG